MSKSIFIDNGMEYAGKVIMKAGCAEICLDDWHGDRIEEAKLLLQGAMGILGEINTANNRAERLDMLTSVHCMMNIAALLVANECHEEASHD